MPISKLFLLNFNISNVVVNQNANVRIAHSCLHSRSLFQTRQNENMGIQIGIACLECFLCWLIFGFMELTSYSHNIKKLISASEI